MSHSSHYPRIQRTISENRKLLRKYIRLLGRYKGMNNAQNALQYFIIVHNFLAIEEKYYDQVMMGKKQINKHLSLITNITYVSTAINYYEDLYDPSNQVRFAIETMDIIEEVRLYLDLYIGTGILNKLILDPNRHEQEVLIEKYKEENSKV